MVCYSSIQHKWKENLWMGHWEGVAPNEKWMGNYYSTGINLLDPDSDNDGVADGTEMGIISPRDDSYLNLLTYGTFPNLDDSRDEMYEHPIIFYEPGENPNPDDDLVETKKYSPDQDPSSTTDPLNPDSDGDGIPDGYLDCGADGDPDNQDTDGSQGNGMFDDGEIRGEDFQYEQRGDYDNYVINYPTSSTVTLDYLLCNGRVDTSLNDNNPANDEPDPLDRDSDDDGRIDGHEGLDEELYEFALDGTHTVYWYDDIEDGYDTVDDRYEGDGLPNVYDTESDGDMVWDGVEAGLTIANINPEHTDLGIFWPDKNPRVTTNPLDIDSDGDDLYDGFEDENENGKYDGFEHGEDIDLDGAIKGDINNDGFMDLVDPIKSQEGEANKGESSEIWEETTPAYYDSDGDGLYDGFDIVDSGVITNLGELSRHNLDPDQLYDPMDQNYHGEDAQKLITDPLNPDTDGDLLWDGKNRPGHLGELDSNNIYDTIISSLSYVTKNSQTGALEYHTRWQDGSDPPYILANQLLLTDPTISDCDEDGLVDGIEIRGWGVDITNGKTLEIEEEGRWVYSNPRVVDTDGDNQNDEFATTDYDEWMYRADPSNIDTDRDYLRDWEEDELSITQVEGEDPEIGEIEGEVTIKWKYIKILGVKVPYYPDEFTLDLTIPVSDNAGLDRLSVWVAGKRMKDIPLYGVKSQTVETSYKASAFKSIFNGYDVEAKVHDVNGNWLMGHWKEFFRLSWLSFLLQ
jgi:hypothetical protein